MRTAAPAAGISPGPRSARMRGSMARGAAAHIGYVTHRSRPAAPPANVLTGVRGPYARSEPGAISSPTTATQSPWRVTASGRTAHTTPPTPARIASGARCGSSGR